LEEKKVGYYVKTVIKIDENILENGYLSANESNLPIWK